MKIIRNLFILGLMIFALLVSVLSAAKYTNSQAPVLSPIPIIASPTPTQIIITPTQVAVTPTKIVEKKVIATPTPTPTPIPSPTSDLLAGKCLVYISGVRYDMTEFRNIHSGGNIFQCGTDMTEIFLGQHPTSYLEKVAKYKI